MKKIFYFLFIMSANFLHAQEIENVRKLDTIYVLFKADKNQIKICKGNSDNNGYYFYNGDDIFFGKDKKGIYYYSSETPFTKIWKPGDERYVNKSFLMKHNSKIIDFHFLKKLAKNNVSFVDLTEKKKVYYVIELSKNKNKKIKLIEVNPPLIVME